MQVRGLMLGQAQRISIRGLSATSPSRPARGDGVCDLNQVRAAPYRQVGQHPQSGS